jgi:hypothetical protein
MVSIGGRPVFLLFCVLNIMINFVELPCYLDLDASQRVVAIRVPDIDLTCQWWYFPKRVSGI